MTLPSFSHCAFPKHGILLCTQVTLYQQLIQTGAVRSLLSCSGDPSPASALTSISALRKLCNHPDLLHRAAAGGDALAGASDIERELAPLFPADYQPGCAAQSGTPDVFLPATSALQWHAHLPAPVAGDCMHARQTLLPNKLCASQEHGMHAGGISCAQ